MTHNRRGIGMTSARTRERLIHRLRDQGVNNESVLDRIRTVPRHLFVDEALASRAYEDTALPIGFGQTISQPYIVAKMTSALIENKELNNVLEIGTGCGYQTAVLAGLVKQIYSLERLKALLQKTRTRLRSLDIYNAKLRLGDGWEGWASKAPFDGILVAAAPPRMPETLMYQLDEGGRMLVPVGPQGKQKLVKIIRCGDSFEQTILDDVSFVPLVEGTQ